MLLSAIGKVFRGPKQFPFLALLPAQEWTDILMDEVCDMLFLLRGYACLYIRNIIHIHVHCKGVYSVHKMYGV